MAQPVLREVDVLTGVEDVGADGVLEGVKVLLPARQACGGGDLIMGKLLEEGLCESSGQVFGTDWHCQHLFHNPR